MLMDTSDGPLSQVWDLTKPTCGKKRGKNNSKCSQAGNNSSPLSFWVGGLIHTSDIGRLNQSSSLRLCYNNKQPHKSTNELISCSCCMSYSAVLPMPPLFLLAKLANNLFSRHLRAKDSVPWSSSWFLQRNMISLRTYKQMSVYSQMVHQRQSKWQCQPGLAVWTCEFIGVT